MDMEMHSFTLLPLSFHRIIILMPAFGLCRRIGSAEIMSNTAQSTLSVRVHGRKSIHAGYPIHSMWLIIPRDEAKAF